MPAREGASGTTERELTELHRAIREGKVAPLYIVTGDDEFRRGQIARNIGRWIIPEPERQVSLICLDGAATPGRIAAELESGSLDFFGPSRRVVFVQDCPLLGAKPPGGREALAPLVRRIEAGIREGTTLVIEATGGFDSRASIARIAARDGVILRFPLVEGHQGIRAFVQDRLKRAGLRIESDALEHMLAICSDDTRQLANEVAKLASYVGPGGVADMEAVRAIVSPSRSSVVFDLADTIAERQVDQALGLVRDLVGRGESAVFLATLLAGRFRMLYQARMLMDEVPEVARLAKRGRYSSSFGAELTKAVPEATRALFPEDKQNSLLKQHPFVAYKSLQAAAGFTAEELAEALGHLLNLDAALKSTTGLEDIALLELVIIELCGQHGRGAAAIVARALD
ncbi:MAG TPA: DNA polymerase III subunit delta [Armatimonadota bacterium]|nr:DNA polymerase III subunit delta [Armatimonadota bacterium]